MISESIEKELKRLVKNCTVKREMLLISAIERSRTKRRLAILSGVLALFSAGAITTVIAKYFGSPILQVLAALSATASGLISLIANNYYTSEETAKIYEGSSKYLMLRNKVSKILHFNSLMETAIEQNYSDLLDEYSLLDQLFSQYDKFRLPKRIYTRSGGSGSYSEPWKAYGYISDITEDIYKRGEPNEIPKHLRGLREVEKAVAEEMERFDNEVEQSKNNKEKL